MKKIINCTPHEICIYDAEDTFFDANTRKLYKKENTKPIKTIPPSGKLLNLKIYTTPVENIDGIPIYKQNIVSFDEIPEEYDIVIVSALYAANYPGKHKDKLYTVCSPVYESPDNPRPVGCLGLQKAK